MLRGLRNGDVRGVIIHKIDRSARNLKDWADLGELIDQGIEVHFANESLDLHSRGGRLSADIQAVVAADYIRNLREETKKGIYGRLKQGFYPLRAPIGYRDNGAAKAKTIDPEKGPLVRTAFTLYGAGQWSIPTLVDELYRRGLRNLAGGRVTRTGLHTILRNPFYTGVMRIRASGETYEGNHDALITKSLFDRVQDILHGRVGTRVNVHDFVYRRFITCAQCGNSLIGELQKGHVYYRCHTKACPKTSIQEEALGGLIAGKLRTLAFSEREKAQLTLRIAELKAAWTANRSRRRSDSASRNCFQANFVFASRSPLKLSFKSVRKCWKCSVIDTIFPMGVRLLSRLGFSSSGQSHLTPSRLLHNRIYFTSPPTPSPHYLPVLG
jgi:hypothetical protein